MDNNNMVELFKQLEKQEYELNFAIQQNTKALNDAISTLDEKVTNQTINEEVKNIYLTIKDLSNKERLDNNDVHMLDDIEQKIGVLYESALKEYQEVEDSIKIMLGSQAQS